MHERVASGDNFYIKAFSPEGAYLGKSGDIVAWKRVYLEIDRMYTVVPSKNYDNPSFLPSSDIVGTCEVGQNKIYVDNTSNLAVGQRVLVVDSLRSGGERHVVSSIGEYGGGKYITIPAPGLTNSFIGGYQSGGRGAAVIKASATYHGTDLLGQLGEAYGTVTDPTGFTFPGCFVNFVTCASGNDHVPYKSLQSQSDRSDFSRVWFNHQGRTNTVHLVLCHDMEGQMHGLSLADEHWSFVSFANAWGGLEETPDIQATVAHELCHQLLDKYMDIRRHLDGGHKLVTSWPGSPGCYCLMATSDPDAYLMQHACAILLARRQPSEDDP